MYAWQQDVKEVSCKKADLVSHTENHTGTIHKCDQCEYSATDIRYLKQHQHKQSDDL